MFFLHEPTKKDEIVDNTDLMIGNANKWKERLRDLSFGESD